MNAKLVIVGGRATRKEICLPLPAKVGRSRESDLTVLHPTVSRRHCELFENNGNVMVRDEGSSNGTFVDGNRVTTAQLKPGDKLTIGPLTFQLIVEPAANGDSPKQIDTQDTTPVAGAKLDTVDMAPKPEATEALDLDALPDVGDEVPEFEPVSLTEKPVTEDVGEIELPDFEESGEPAVAEEESLDLEPLSLSDAAEAEPSAELELPAFDEVQDQGDSTEPAMELQPLDADDVPFELDELSEEPAGKAAESVEGPVSLDPLDADDEVSLEMLPEIEEVSKPVADGQSGSSEGGELTDEELDKFLSELD